MWNQILKNKTGVFQGIHSGSEYGSWHSVVLQLDTKISENYAAYIFKVKA
jgi:hypothetical protein